MGNSEASDQSGCSWRGCQKEQLDQEIEEAIAKLESAWPKTDDEIDQYLIENDFAVRDVPATDIGDSRVCTWESCDDNAKHIQRDNNGNPWADLCQKHHDMLEGALDDLNPRNMLKFWVKARGGASVASKQS